MAPLTPIRLRKFKDLNLEGATVVEGFPAVGLVAGIAATYLIRKLELDHYAALESDDFPPVTLVWNGKPRGPARVYAREDPPIAVFLGEFTPAPRLFRPLARTVLQFAREHRVKEIISPDGVLPVDPDYKEDAPRVFGVATTDAARERLTKADIPPFEQGVLAGVSAMLLAEATNDFDVTHILVEAAPREVPGAAPADARAAAVLLEAVGRLHKGLRIDATPLYEEAARVEQAFRMWREGAARAAGQDEEAAIAYR